ncbi:MAG: glycosyltransferase [Erysipelotrichaceae bacterium]|nr:glycosyltransferase [Erysipelotrichaceae bacterium]MCH4121176.1 glycosyltransferase [Erysipelotrichaceae bacterium]
MVPVYNCEKYLPRCLDSLLNQIYSNFRIILIDDGSTDGSSTICDSYEAKDQRIVVIHQKNGGVSNARNKGIEYSDEEYLMFVDADDYVEESYVFDLYHGLVDHQADLSITPGYDEDENGNLLIHWNENDYSHEVGINSYDWNGSEQHPIVWGALFKRDLIGDIRFDSKYYVGEDSLFFAEYLKNVKKLYYVHKPLYHYIHYSQSAAFGKFDNKKITELYAWQKICEEYDYRYDIVAAYAMRSKETCLRYYIDANFRDKYFKSTVNEYKQNLKALLQYYRSTNNKKLYLTAKAFAVMPNLYCKIKNL